MGKPTRNEALHAVRTLIEYIGDDPDRPGLLKTPERVLKAWYDEWGAGYRDMAFETTVFDNEGVLLPYDQMVFVKDIVFFSTCEHHLSPFFGTACVAYIPEKKIVGLSKLARIVTHFAARLQVQERLVSEIAEFIEQEVSVHCAVMLEA